MPNTEYVAVAEVIAGDTRKPFQHLKGLRFVPKGSIQAKALGGEREYRVVVGKVTWLGLQHCWVEQRKTTGWFRHWSRMTRKKRLRLLFREFPDGLIAPLVEAA